MRSSAWPMRPSGITIGSLRSSAPNTSMYQSIAAAGSPIARYGVSERSRAGVYSRTSFIGATSVLTVSATFSRRRSAAANAGRGASGMVGSRRESNGSVGIELTSRVSDSERVAGADEKGLGRVNRAVEVLGDVRHGQSVDVAQRERGAVMRPELIEHLVRARAFEQLVDAVGHLLLVGERLQAARLARLAAPVVDELVPRHADQPRDGEVWDRAAFDRLHCGEEGVGREVFGDRLRAGPHTQISVHLGQRPVVH